MNKAVKWIIWLIVIALVVVGIMMAVNCGDDENGYEINGDNGYDNGAEDNGDNGYDNGAEDNGDENGYDNGAEDNGDAEEDNGDED